MDVPAGAACREALLRQARELKEELTRNKARLSQGQLRKRQRKLKSIYDRAREAESSGAAGDRTINQPSGEVNTKIKSEAVGQRVHENVLQGAGTFSPKIPTCAGKHPFEAQNAIGTETAGAGSTTAASIQSVVHHLLALKQEVEWKVDAALSELSVVISHGGVHGPGSILAEDSAMVDTSAAGSKPWSGAQKKRWREEPVGVDERDSCRDLTPHLQPARASGVLPCAKRRCTSVDSVGLCTVASVPSPDSRPCRKDMSMMVSLLRPGIETEMCGDSSVTDLGWRQRAAFPFGNYHNYYQYRVGEAFDEDPRLQALRQEWFKGRDCIDIGCNEGVITIALAYRFQTGSMHGIDIDNFLVTKAIRNLLNLRQHISKRLRDRDYQGERKALERGAVALRNVSFATDDWLENSAGGEGLFDTVLCLSVTKWVHLHNGDKGVEMLFRKAWMALRPGGHFILEPQDLKSYRQAKRKQDMTMALFCDLKMLHLKPDDFPKFLIDKIGFRLVRTLSVKKSIQGFDRPIHIFVKPDLPITDHQRQERNVQPP
ncbi:unnamed protein product [Ostreobium quekettii]|uniref:RNA methyltransferase n=1 Tax=Ostreobium quekettii TaxID=121088 RepID=A0A8S1IST3_9CHLO|nr:unnamed protein product [Ostreobium quekettii]